MYRSTLLLALSVVLISSCQSDPVVLDKEETINANIPLALASYFETFKKKASEYDIVVDYDNANITAEIKLIDEGSVAGTCSTNGHDLRHITIDQAFWNRASHLLREMVVFHELGHCVLGRGHEENSFDNGICRSIMRSGLGTCRDAYTPNNREYFIEELFTEDSGF